MSEQNKSIVHRIVKKLAILVVAIVFAAVAGSPISARASGICPAPGTGLPGALNMVADATMLTIPMARNSPNGNAGMTIAVGNTYC